MDKTEFEQFEYLPSNNEMDSSQLLVVQEDGTFLCFDRPIQYVTQVDDAKDVLEGVQGCDVYDVAPEQLYIDGENSAELISVSDQFISPEGHDNAYANNYLLQDDNNAQEEPMEQDEDVQYKEITESEETITDDADVENAEDKNSGDCTEITLNDEQYQLLEQKGWILLESSDNTFLLDSSGLHDITADEKLILKLKTELQEEFPNEVSSTIKETVAQEHKTIKVENTQPDVMDLPNIHYIIEDDGNEEENEPETDINFTNNKQGSLKAIFEETIEEPDVTPIEAEHDYIKLSSVKDSFVKKQNDTIRIKTKFSFKDVPPEIVLGKFNGKKLVARVVKTERPVKKLGMNIKDPGPSYVQSDFTGLDDDQFEKLILKAVRHRIECGVTDVTAAEIVVVQLSRVAAFRPALMERGLIITKIIIHEHESGELYSESDPSLVTGRAMRDSLNNCRFKFMPEMLWKLASTIESQNVEEYSKSGKYDFLHIHIRETKGLDGIIRISITLNKRNIPLHLFKDFESQYDLFACTSCDGIFDTEGELQRHQENECTHLEAMNAYTMIETSRGKQYACDVCNIVYTKLANCREHIKTHFKAGNAASSAKTSKIQIISTIEKKKPLGLYRCKMCNRAYLDAATLSRHLVSRHIKQTKT
ncbi:jg3384 [Pararge aegeria aegeria]|uniref:Jg3384 protein n=1 Tax=Pararge aegeria aegeria TaxID=348720 RepID=A0A8S4RNS8_9NEOP|nr:jg3384 [Pararge aegeria aegeria]